MFYLDREKLTEKPLQNDPGTAAVNGRFEVSDWQEHFAHLAQTARDPRLRTYYQAGMVAADTPLAEVPLLAVDFETTGLNPRKNSIVSIGLLPMSLKRIRCAESRHWILRPRSGLNRESVVIHGITHQALEEAPDLEEILGELLPLMAGKVLVVHYRGIERPFLKAALQARLGEGIEFPVIDTMELEARLHRKKRLSWWQKLLGRKPTSIRLADSRSRYHLPWYKPHHALTDALATAELLQAQVAYHYSPETPVRRFWK